MLIYVLLTVLVSAEPGTRADRTALFDDLLDKTMAREAFSVIKNDGSGSMSRRTCAFVEEKRAQFKEQRLLDGAATETTDGGS